MFLESFHETVELLLALSQTRRHLLKYLLLGVLAESTARFQHFIDVFLLQTPHMQAHAPFTSTSQSKVNYGTSYGS